MMERITALTDGSLIRYDHPCSSMAPSKQSTSMVIDSDSDISIDLEETTKGKGKGKGKGDKRKKDKSKPKPKDTVSFTL